MSRAAVYPLLGALRSARRAWLVLAAALGWMGIATSVQAATYANRVTPFSWVDPASHARAEWSRGAACSANYVGAAIDDDITAQLPLGFIFNYGGVDYTQVQIMSNGRLQFNNGFCGYGTQTVGPPPTYPYPYPNASVVRTLRVYGTDLDPTPSGTGGVCPTATCYVSYVTEGTAPNRRFVVTWVNVPEWGRTVRTGYFNLQIILEEATQEFVYQFGASDHPTGGSAQIGWQLDTTDYDVWSTPVVPPPSSAVRFFIPAPVAELRMDEAIWSGAGTVINSTSGGISGSPVGAAQTLAGGKLCRGGAIPLNTAAALIDAIDTGYDVDSQIGSSGTLTFWYRSNTAWSGAGSKGAQLLDATVAGNAWFYLTRQNGNGRLSFNVTDAAGTTYRATTGNRSYAANSWVHVAVTWKLAPVAGSNRLQVFLNGALAATAAIPTSQPLASAIGSLFVGDNRSAFVANPGTGNSADGTVDEVRIYNSEVTAAVILRDYTASRICAPVSVAPTGLNAFESSTPAARVAGVIKTKVAASAFGLDVVALNPGATAMDTAFTGDVKLELVDASSGASCSAYNLINTVGVMTFVTADQGRKTRPAISEANAWPNVRLRMTYPATGTPTLIACSNDNFAIRPASLASVTASDATSKTAGSARPLSNIGATGGNVHKAGQPFSLAATARNAVGSTTGNYAGSPGVTLTACVLPGAGCTLGAVTSGGWVAASGVISNDSVRYSEVGAVTLKLVDTSFSDVDAADSTPLERFIESLPVNVGRFVPDHFDLAPASLPVFKTFNDTACGTRSFTYVGQPFGYVTVPQATIAAKNAAGNVTVNYAGPLWKLAPPGVIPTYSVPPAHTLDGIPVLPAVSSTGSGTGSIVMDLAERVFFKRTAPVVRFPADISLSIEIGDSTENAVTGNGTIDTLTPALFPSMAFDAGNEIRFGQLALTNAHGSELLALPVPVETQFWTGTGFTRNTVDFCTQLAANTVALTNWRSKLNACETSVSLSGRVNAGKGNLKLSAPGTGNTGSVDLTLQLAGAGGDTCVGGIASSAAGASQPWLQRLGAAGGYDQNPAARASFGRFRGSKALIYMREIY